MDKFIIKKLRLENNSPNKQARSPPSSVNEGRESTSNTSDSACPVGRATTSCAGRAFQSSWLMKYPWLEYNKNKNIVFCSLCKKCFENNMLTCCKKEDVYTTKGFNDWKHALERFRSHEKTECHREATEKTKLVEKGINVQKILNSSQDKEMKLAREALHKIFTSIQYLTRQGLAIRGHTDKGSNLHQLLALRACDTRELSVWLKRSKHKWLSHDVQDEIVELMAHEVLRQEVQKIIKAQYFALIMDESTDISTQEQISVFFRYVDENCEVNESFVGFYETADTTSQGLFLILNDVLKRFGLSFVNCRGQCYDGASNVAGKLSGVQQKVKEIQPSAVFVHCTAHCLNLTVQDTIQTVPVIRDAFNTLKDLINCIKESPKRMALFKNIQKEKENELDNVLPNLRPLCITRWLCRVKSVNSVLENYNGLLEFLEESSLDKNSPYEFAAKCSGYLKILLKFDFFFSLRLVKTVLEPVEEVTRIIQAPSVSLRNVVRRVTLLQDLIKSYRQDRRFTDFWKDVLQESEVLLLDPPALPRSRRPPRKLDNGNNAHVFLTPEDYYRRIYFEVIDTILKTLTERYDSPVFSKLQNIEEKIIEFVSPGDSAVFHGVSSVMKSLFDGIFEGDINFDRLALHLLMLKDLCSARKNISFSNFSDLKHFLNSDSNLCSTLTEIMKILRLFYTVPVTTCSAERSFSMLRRLKNYLRSTMKQTKLNHFAILNSYKDNVEELNIEELINIFIERQPQRRNVFSLC